MNNTPRWKQRCANFQNAYQVFVRRADEYLKHPTEEVYQMALVQAFEIIIELSWKTLKDYLENQGHSTIRGGKQAIRQAFQDDLIKNPETWLLALDMRNETSHTYNLTILQKVLNFISKDFYAALTDLNQHLKRL